MAKQQPKPVEQAVVDPVESFLYLTIHPFALDRLTSLNSFHLSTSSPSSVVLTVL